MDAPHLGYRNHHILWYRAARLAPPSPCAEVLARVETPSIHPSATGFREEPAVLERSMSLSHSSSFDSSTLTGPV